MRLACAILLLPHPKMLTARDLMEQQELRKDPLEANVVRLDKWIENSILQSSEFVTE